MLRFPEIILGLLAVLIICSPFLLIWGVPLIQVIGMDVFWGIIWFVIAMVGRRYEH
jgi:hypothetical protein